MKYIGKKKDWRITISMLAIAMILFFSILIVSPKAYAVSFENSNYKITCLPETSGIRPVGIWYEQVCWFENKKDTSVQADFAMLFEDQLRSGTVHEWTTVETVLSYVYYCPTEDYGVEDSENVYCTFPNGTQIVYTGTERSFDTSGPGAYVHYNFSTYRNDWVDRTSHFSHYSIGAWDKPNAYYVEDVNWDAGETRIVRFRYNPQKKFTNTKWDALFADISTQSILLRLDPLTNPNYYSHDWPADFANKTASIISGVVNCSSLVDMPDFIMHYAFDVDTNDSLGVYDGEVYNATLNASGGKYSGAYFFNGSAQFINTTFNLSTMNNDASISLWFKTYNTSIPSWQSLVGTGASSDSDWIIRIMTNGTVNSNIRPNGGTPSATIHSTTTVLDNAWHHLVVSYNNSAQDFYMYLDNVKMDNASINLNNVFNQDRHNFIGARNDQGTADQFFNGWIDEFLFINGSLTAAQVDNLYNERYPYNVTNTGACDYNSSKFEIDWRIASITYTKSSEGINLTLLCDDNTSTKSLAGTSGTMRYNCSDDDSTVNMSYVLDLSENASMNTLIMQNTGSISINITFKDSKTKDVIDFQNVSLQIIGDYLSRSYTNDSGGMYITALDIGNYTFRYSSTIDGNTTYPEKFYYFDVTENTNLTLYLTNSTTAINVTITIYDETGEEVENALVKALRYDVTSNSYLLDESALSNFQGQVFFNLELYNEYYQFIVEYPSGTVKKSTNGAYLTDTDVVIYINLAEDYFDKYFQIGSITYTLDFINASNNFEFYWNDADAEISRACLRVFKQNNLNGSVLYNETCTSSVTGTSYVGVANVNGTTYRGIAVVTIDGSDYSLDELWHSFYQDNVFGNLGVFLSILLLLVIISISRWSLPVSMILFTVSATFLFVVGILDVPYYIGIPLIVVGIISAILISKR